MEIDNLVSDLSSLTEIDAIVLGGSRATKRNDSHSDYDVYVYAHQYIDVSIREAILNKYCSYLEIKNQYWEEEDDCILNSGTVIELIYRDSKSISLGLDHLLKEYCPSNSYSTCIWNNVESCLVLFERNQYYTNLKEKYNIPYPEELRKNIIQRGKELLFDKLPSYDKQILKASKRKDYVSVNHRKTEFLATYFDLIFALNRISHPGEKRMLEIAKEKCKILPQYFEEDINNLLLAMEYSDLDFLLKEMKKELYKVLDK